MRVGLLQYPILYFPPKKLLRGTGSALFFFGDKHLYPGYTLLATLRLKFAILFSFFHLLFYLFLWLLSPILMHHRIKCRENKNNCCLQIPCFVVWIVWMLTFQRKALNIILYRRLQKKKTSLTLRQPGSNSQANYYPLTPKQNSPKALYKSISGYLKRNRRFS